MGSAAPRLEKPFAAPDWRRRSLPYVALIAFALRLVVIVFARTYHYPPDHDHFQFGLETGSIARSIAAGEGFASPFTGSTGPTAWIAPVYPYLCAAVFKVFGIFTDASAIVILALNSLFAALTCLPMFAIGRRLFGASVAWWAVLAWSVTPHFMKWPTEWIWEASLSGLLVALALLMALQLADSSATRRWLIAGLLWGLIALTNPVLLTLVAWSLLWIWWRSANRRAAVRGAALALALTVVMVAPWLVRNRDVFGRWVFIRSNFGFELHLGNYHGSFGMGWGGMHPSLNQRQWERYRDLGELAYVEEHRRAAMDFIRQYPGEFLSLCATRWMAFWDGSALNYAYFPAPWRPWQFAAISLLALGGWLMFTVAKRREAWLLFWIVLYPAPYYITYPQPRYRHPVEPELLLLGVFFLAALAVRVQSWFTHNRRHSA